MLNKYMRYLSNKSHREYPSAAGLNFIHLCSAGLIHLDSHTLKPSYETKVKGIQRLTFFFYQTHWPWSHFSRWAEAVVPSLVLFVCLVLYWRATNLLWLVGAVTCVLCNRLLCLPFLSRALSFTHTHTNTQRLFFHCLFFDSTHTSLYQLTLFTCFLTYSNTDQLYSETRALTSNQKLGMAI